MNLSETDLELVDALRDDGRASFEALSARVGLSRRMVRAHVQRLLDDGVVRVVATVRPEFDGVHAIGHLSVTVAAAREQVAQRIAQDRESVFVSIVSGHAGIVAEMRTADLQSLGRAVERVRSLEGVSKVATLVYSEVVTEPHLPPPPRSDRAAPTLDALDRTLVGLLRADGRSSYAELAAQVGLSPAATRTRVRNLLDWGVIRIVAMINPTRLGRYVMSGFAADLTGPAADTVRRLEAIESLDFLALTLGGADVIGTVVTATIEDTVAVLDRIGTVEGIAGFRSWTHLRLVQERYDAG